MQVFINIGRSVEEESRECVVEKGSCAQLWKRIVSQRDLQERNELTPPKQLRETNGSLETDQGKRCSAEKDCKQQQKRTEEDNITQSFVIH